MRSSMTGVFHFDQNVFKVHPCCMSILHVFLLPNNILLYEYATFYLFIYQLLNIRVMSTFCGNVAMNFISLGYIPRSEIVESVSNSTFKL